MSAGVNLLLLLSALLSALTGANTRVQATPASVAVAQVAVRSVAAAPSRAVAAGRPAVELPPVAAIALTTLPVAWRLAAIAPLFQGRRRE